MLGTFRGTKKFSFCLQRGFYRRYSRLGHGFVKLPETFTEDGSDCTTIPD